jgi:hypothetical protein
MSLMGHTFRLSRMLSRCASIGPILLHEQTFSTLCSLKAEATVREIGG